MCLKKEKSIFLAGVSDFSFHSYLLSLDWLLKEGARLKFAGSKGRKRMPAINLGAT